MTFKYFQISCISFAGSAPSGSAESHPETSSDSAGAQLQASPEGPRFFFVSILPVYSGELSKSCGSINITKLRKDSGEISP